MSIDLRMILQMEAAQAKAETAAATSEVKKLTTATGELGSKSKAAASAADSEAAAKKRNAQASREMADGNRRAAAATGNLVANLNDIGMMLAAGQSPLMLAVQQGTQITQVFAGQGASGAVKMLGTALVEMVNPLNLVVLGAIAAGGAMIQWLTSADDEADALNAQLERQKTAIEGIVAETERLRLQRGMLLSGAQTEDEQVVLERNNALLAERAEIDAELARLQANFASNVALAGVTETMVAKQALEARREAINSEIVLNTIRQIGLDAQRAQTAETVKAADVAGQLEAATRKTAYALQTADGNKLVAAFSAAFPIASQLLGMAQGIVATIGGIGPLDPGVGMGRGNSPGGPLAGSADLAGLQAGGGVGRTKPVVAAGGGGGGGAAARDEADALQELIAGLEAEIEALRVQDPLQQEMLKHREALAGATEAEKKKVEELIATREREAMLMEGAKARAEFFGDIGNQALDALIMKGESFNDVLKGIISSLIKAIAQAALFGTGPFGSLFGGGSALSLIFPALKAEGGMIHGPGTGTSDSIPTMLSNGEFVVNARSTARNRHLLEAINSGGRVSGFAEGGMVGGDNRRLAGRGGSALPSVIYQDFRGTSGDREIDRIARAAAAQMVQLYDREGLPVSIQRVSGDPRSRG